MCVSFWMISDDDRTWSLYDMIPYNVKWYIYGSFLSSSRQAVLVLLSIIFVSLFFPSLLMLFSLFSLPPMIWLEVDSFNLRFDYHSILVHSIKVLWHIMHLYGKYNKRLIWSFFFSPFLGFSPMFSTCPVMYASQRPSAIRKWLYKRVHWCASYRLARPEIRSEER